MTEMSGWNATYLNHLVQDSNDPNAFAIAGSGGEDETEKNPEFAILAMRSSWSSVVHCLLNTYFTPIGGPSEMAATADLALESASANIAGNLVQANRAFIRVTEISSEYTPGNGLRSQINFFDIEF